MQQSSLAPPFEFLTGFECTHIFGSGTDVLETSGHLARYRSDLAQLAKDGIRTFRCPVPWHRIERCEGHYDWAWMDGYLACARHYGLDPIADPLHHTSFPEWLKGGFLHPRFSLRYRAFVRAFAERYSWIRKYTKINEPYVTSWFCGGGAIWHPGFRGYDTFIPMLVTVSRVLAEVGHMLDEMIPGVEFIHVDSCEFHEAHDEESLGHATRLNLQRWLVLDLALGRVNEQHPLRSFLLKHWASEEDLEWLQEHPTRIDVLGLDYYPDSEQAWNRQGRVIGGRRILGFAEVARQYARRYQVPVMLSETNVRGYVSDRITWLKYMVGESEALAASIDVPFAGFCWYPYIDSTDWCSRCTQANGNIDPQGIYWLSEGTLARNSSELSALYAGLAKGLVNTSDIPAYAFCPEVLDMHSVRDYLPHLASFDWVDPSSR